MVLVDVAVVMVWVVHASLVLRSPPCPIPHPTTATPSQDEGHCSFVAERAELLLRQAAQFGLHTRAACVEYLGNLFRATLDAPARKTDYQVRREAQPGCGAWWGRFGACRQSGLGGWMGCEPGSCCAYHLCAYSSCCSEPMCLPADCPVFGPSASQPTLLNRPPTSILCPPTCPNPTLTN